MRGSITKRSAGSWTIQASGGFDDGGRRQRFTRTVRGTESAAQKALTKLLREIDTNTVTLGGSEPTAAFLERWIAHRCTNGNLRSKTASTYRGYVKRDIAPIMGKKKIGDVRPAHIQRVLDSAATKGLSARSRTQIRAILHAGFHTAVQWGSVTTNPVDGTTRPKLEAPNLTIPDATDMAKLLAGIEPAYRVPLALSAATGLRRGEVLALEWGNVTLDGQRPHLLVEGTLQRVDGKLTVLPPKTPRSRRSVPLPASLVGLLKAHRAAQLERRLLVGPAWMGSYVFDRGDGRPVDPDRFGKAFRAARNAAGLPTVRLHDVRHGLATMLVADGMNPRLVSDLMGHATVGFTLQTYVHPDEDDAAAVATDTERLLGDAIAGN